MGIVQGSEEYYGSSRVDLIDLETVSRAAWEHSRSVVGENLPPDLLSFLIACSWCGKRVGKLPRAKDSKDAISSIRSGFEELSDKYTPEEIKECIDAVSDFDSRIIKSQLEDFFNEDKSRIIYSPLFKEFSNAYPYIEPDEFEIHYKNCRENFTEAGIASLRRRFKQTPPPELSDRTDWAQSNHQYLPAFLKKWREDLKKIETRMRIAQKAWKESIS